MRKFTIFTVLLCVVILVVVSELVSGNYIPFLSNKTTEEPTDLSQQSPLPDSLDVTKSATTNVLGSDAILEETATLSDEISPEDLMYQDLVTGDETAMEDEEVEPDKVSREGQSEDFENLNYVSGTDSVYLRQEQIESAGFVSAYIEKEPHNGELFKTIYIDDLYDTKAEKYVIKNDETLFAKVYVFTVGENSSVDEVYEVLKARASEGLSTELNETNDFGRASFYMNDSKRNTTAFLVVKLDHTIYCFSYPKEYHSQIKNLVLLVAQEF